MLERFNLLFPIWAVLLSIIAYNFPDIFLSMKAWVTYLLAVIMFGMGITLRISDFRRLVYLKRIIVIGLAMQFILMPFIAWFISRSFNLSVPLLAGIILVGACPGGTASNVICYLAKGNVALSVTLTSLSTFLAVVFTPLLTWIYLGKSVDVPVLKMMLTVFQIIILPICLGVILNNLYGVSLELMKQIFPSVSILSICLIIAIIVASNQNEIQTVATVVILAVAVHNLLGLLAGYFISYCLGYSIIIRKTLAIEVGMQNSGLAVALATEYFKPLVALPGAIFSIWHNISGSLLAAIWSKQTKQIKE